MNRSIPPFRADHVGSLLRPAVLKEARARHERGEIAAAALTAVEDAAVQEIVKRQAEIGLRSATDGELRRAMWHFDFLEKLDGVESSVPIMESPSKAASKPRPRGFALSASLAFRVTPCWSIFGF